MQRYDSFQFHGFFHSFEESLSRYEAFACSWSYRLRFGGRWWCWMTRRPTDVGKTLSYFLQRGWLLRRLTTIVISSRREVSNEMFEIARRITSRDSGGIKRKKNLRDALVFILNSVVLKFPLGRNPGHSTSYPGLGNFIVYPSPSFKCAIKVLPLSSGAVDKKNIIPPWNDYAVCRRRADRISGMCKCNERKYFTIDISAFHSAAPGRCLRIVRSISVCGRISCIALPPRFYRVAEQSAIWIGDYSLPYPLFCRQY